MVHDAGQSVAIPGGMERTNKKATLHITFVITGLGAGGAERATANLANHWVDRGFRVSIITIASQKEDFYRLQPSITRVALDLYRESSGVISGTLQNLWRVRVLSRVLREMKPDVAIGMMPTANALLAYAGRGMAGLLTIGSERIHPPCLPLPRQWEFIRSRAYGHLSAVTALTEKSAAWLRKHTRAKRVVVIPNAVLWPLPANRPRVDPAVWGQTDRKRLLAVGRLVPQKGFDLLVTAFARLAPQHPDWELVIIGEGSSRPALEAQVQRTGLQDRIVLPGVAGNLADWYRAADAYVLSSRFEGFPNTLVEALAHGLPSVSFDCDTGPREIIRHGIDGLLVPVGDVAALTDALDRLMSDPELRKRLSIRAIEVKQRYHIDNVSQQWVNLFQSLRARLEH